MTPGALVTFHHVAAIDAVDVPSLKTLSGLALDGAVPLASLAPLSLGPGGLGVPRIDQAANLARVEAWVLVPMSGRLRIDVECDDVTAISLGETGGPDGGRPWHWVRGPARFSAFRAVTAGVAERLEVRSVWVGAVDRLTVSWAMESVEGEPVDCPAMPLGAGVASHGERPRGVADVLARATAATSLLADVQARLESALDATAGATAILEGHDVP